MTDHSAAVMMAYHSVPKCFTAKNNPTYPPKWSASKIAHTIQNRRRFQ